MNGLTLLVTGAIIAVVPLPRRGLLAAIRENRRRALEAMRRRDVMQPSTAEPKPYDRLNDRWLHLSRRRVAEAPTVRDVKDAMNHEVPRHLNTAGIERASATFESVGLTPSRTRHGGGVPPRDEQRLNGGSPQRVAPLSVSTPTRRHALRAAIHSLVPASPSVWYHGGGEGR